jgi:spore coat polysaccharide biosynthesis protein SpsF
VSGTGTSSASVDAASARIVATIEARMTSSRLPGKVLMPIGGVPALGMMVERLQRSQTITGICLATTTNADDDPLAALAREVGIDCHRGSEPDVLGRVLDAADSVAADVIVETTGDCPMIDPGLLDACVLAYLADDVHYCSNSLTPGLPDGLDVQVFSTALLREVAAATDDPADREHVSLYIYEHPERYRIRNVTAPASVRRPDWRWTVDTEDDLAFVRTVVDALGRDVTARDAVRWLDDHPEVVARNAHVVQKPAR